MFSWRNKKYNLDNPSYLELWYCDLLLPSTWKIVSFINTSIAVSVVILVCSLDKRMEINRAAIEKTGHYIWPGAQHSYKMHVNPSKIQNQPGHLCSLIRVLAGYFVCSQGSKASSGCQWRLISLCWVHMQSLQNALPWRILYVNSNGPDKPSEQGLGLLCSSVIFCRIK